MCEQCGPADDESIQEQVKSFLARREAAAREAADAETVSATVPSSNDVEAADA